MAYTVAGEQFRKIGGQLLEIHRQVCQLGGYPFDPEGLSRHLQAGIEGRFAVSPSGIIAPVTPPPQISEQPFSTEVDYGGRKVEEMLKASKKAGYLADFNSDITRANFPSSYRGRHVIPMRIAFFGREIGEFERRQIFAANRLIELGALELVALNNSGALLDGKQLPIAACERFLLGSDGYWCWPCLGGDYRGRYVNLAWSNVLRSGWDGYWSFLVASVDELLVALSA